MTSIEIYIKKKNVIKKFLHYQSGKEPNSQHDLWW